MPDSPISPGGGPASFDERDLDAVLAGETVDLPDGLRPVADVLAALSAGPAPAELYGEMAAMAEFRALGLGRVERPAGQAATLLLEAPRATRRTGRPRRPPARHRARPSRRRAPRRAVLLGAAAAAAVIVLAVLVTGNLAGSSGSVAHLASSSAGRSSATGTTGQSAAPREETTSAAKDPTVSPSAPNPATPAQSLAATTCWDYYSAYKDQELSPWVTQQPLWERLIKLAGSKSRVKVKQFCAPYVKGLFPGGLPAANLPSAHDAQGNAQGNQNDNFTGPQSGGPAEGSRTGSGSNQTGSDQTGSDQTGSGQSSTSGSTSGSGTNP